MSAVVGALASTEGQVEQKERNAALYGRRRRCREDLKALVAISLEEFASAGSPNPARDVYDFLTELHEIESGEDWRHGDHRAVGHNYTRSSVRMLIRDSRKSGYWSYGNDGKPRLLGESIDSAWPTTQTLKLAEDRKNRFFPEE